MLPSQQYRLKVDVSNMVMVVLEFMLAALQVTDETGTLSDIRVSSAFLTRELGPAVLLHK